METEKHEHGDSQATLKTVDGTATCRVELAVEPQGGYVVRITAPNPKTSAARWRVTFDGIPAYES
jgi:hypothetical protein